jgi:hypothetical protein
MMDNQIIANNLLSILLLLSLLNQPTVFCGADGEYPMELGNKTLNSKINY